MDIDPELVEEMSIILLMEFGPSTFSFPMSGKISDAVHILSPNVRQIIQELDEAGYRIERKT